MQVLPSKLHGDITVPSSKSHTMRAILFASLATGVSRITKYLPSPDTQAMIAACRLFGANIMQFPDSLEITGVAGQPCFTDPYIHAGNSGQVLRFIGAIAGLAEQKIVIDGDGSQRPIGPLIAGLRQFGCQANADNNYAPFTVQGKFSNNFARICGMDSQPVSGLLIARAFAKDTTRLEVTNPGEKPWVNLTLDWFERLGIECIQHDFTHFHLPGFAKVLGFNYQVPGDFSSAAFPLVAAILTRSNIMVHNLDMQDIQGDKKIVQILQAMGAEIEIDAVNKQLKVGVSNILQGLEIDVNDIIDAIPILAVLGCFAQGTTRLTGAEIARNKESNRLAVMCHELKKLGANIHELTDGLCIENSTLRTGAVNSHHDHRVAMSLAVAGLAIPCGVNITGSACIDKSFPEFVDKMRAIGANIV